MGRLDTYIGNWGGVRLLGGGRPGVPPLKEKGWEPAHSSAPFWGHLPPGGRHDGRAGEDTRPYGDCGRKTAGAQCAPLQERGRKLPPHPPPSGAPFPIPSVPSGHLPLTRGVGPQGEGLGNTKRDRSGTCPLKPRGEAELRTKFLCLLSFSKKGGDPAPPRRVRFLI